MIPGLPSPALRSAGRPFPPSPLEDTAVDASPSLFLHETVALPPVPFAIAPWTDRDPQAASRGLSPRALARALDYIERHIGDTITLADIASAACISRFHFARLFRISTGRSPMEFVLAKRIALAKEQLARGPQKISATAASLGFFDQSHFTRTFRRMTGYSPREFCHLHAPVTRTA
ncbi:AraC-type DNA-binding protein [Pseudoxanthomonas sp. CF385]|nr:AraC-type DNA-binding protein [Pseudoxanthomonas sp. CF385]